MKRPLVERRPSTPALAEATQRLLLLNGPIPAWMIGCLIPSISVSRVLNILYSPVRADSGACRDVAQR